MTDRSKEGTVQSRITGSQESAEANKRFRDRVYLLWILLAVLYLMVLRLSGCQFDDGPLAFVRGCHNDGVDWNGFMAPIGFVIILVLPV
jgi:hypothetical protein